MNKVFDLIKETIKGKTLHRIIFNWQVAEHCVGLAGVCVDLASSKNPSYARYWKVSPQKLVRVDINEQAEPDIVANLDEKLPIADNFADNVFFFNSFYLLQRPDNILKEAHRILKPGGRAFLTAEFVKSEESKATDWQRFTSRKLSQMLKVAGFDDFKILPTGERFAAVCNLGDFVLNFSFFNIFKVPGRALCLLLDKLTPKRLKENYPCPISWFVIAKK